MLKIYITSSGEDMRNAVANKRRNKQDCVGCGTGLFRFILLVAVLGIAAIFISNAYFGSDIADKIRKTQYPVKYEYFVEKYSNQYGLDKYLVYSVIRCESRFDRHAVSSADAKGLMQLTDETGEHCAKRANIDKFDSSALFDPEINIHLGCYYLSELLKKYGSVDTALAAYNGGPGNVDKWLRNSRYSDGKNLISIPFDETKNYVKRVNDSIKMYKTIYDVDN